MHEQLENITTVTGDQQVYSSVDSTPNRVHESFGIVNELTTTHEPTLQIK